MSGLLKCGTKDRHGTDADTCGGEDSVGNGRGNSNDGCLTAPGRWDAGIVDQVDINFGNILEPWHPIRAG